MSKNNSVYNVIIIYILLILLLVSIHYYYYYLLGQSYEKLSRYNNIDNKTVAIFITGQIRDQSKKTLTSIKNYLIYPFGYNVKVFCHFNKDTSNKDKLLINKLFSPIYIEYDDINSELFLIDHTKNLKLLSWRLYKCNLQKTSYELANNMRFDIVIRIRPDILLYKKIEQKYINNIKENTLYSAEFDKITNISTIYTISDQFAFGKSNVMDIYCDIYNHLDKYKNITCKYNEYIYYRYMTDNNIKLARFLYNGSIIRFLNISIFHAGYKLFNEKKTLYLPKEICNLLDNK